MRKRNDGFQQRKWSQKFQQVILVLVVGTTLFSGCKKEEAIPPPPPTVTQPLPTKTPGPTPTPREMQNPTPTPRSSPTVTIEQGNGPSLPDFSQVRLHAVTFLEDPMFFQVSLDGWPKEVGEDVAVRVGEEVYTCERLFPDLHPFRVFCWGASPPEGSHQVLDVFVAHVADPVVQVPFQVPYLPEPTPTK
ncbi:MAG: hypothetical protein P8046_11820 [Anaerolineales bacterium]